MNTMRIIALVVLVLAAASLIYGIVAYSDYRNSVAGKITGAARGIARELVGKRKVEKSDIERRSIAFMIGGGVGVVAAGVLFFLKIK